MKHPSHYYLVYLITRGYTTAMIMDQMGELELPLPSNELGSDHFKRYLSELRAETQPPPHFAPSSRPMPPATATWLKKQKIFNLWDGDPQALRAVDVLTAGEIRRFVDILLLSPMSFAGIVEKTTSWFGLDQNILDVGTLKFYAHYFWNPSCMAEKEWVQFLKMYGCHSPDEILLSLRVPRTMGGIATILAAAGAPEQIQPVVLFTTMRDQAFKMFMRHASVPGSYHLNTQGMFQALMMVMHAEEQLDKYRGGSSDLIEELQKIETQHDETTVPHLLEYKEKLRSLVVDTTGEVLEEKRRNQ